jgi:hypothetical protein
LSSTIDGNEKDRGRRVVRAEDITDEELALIEAAEVSAEFAYLDEELTDIESASSVCARNAQSRCGIP